MISTAILTGVKGASGVTNTSFYAAFGRVTFCIGEEEAKRIAGELTKWVWDNFGYHWDGAEVDENGAALEGDALHFAHMCKNLYDEKAVVWLTNLMIARQEGAK